MVKKDQNYQRPPPALKAQLDAVPPHAAAPALHPHSLYSEHLPTVRSTALHRRGQQGLTMVL